MSSAEVFFVFLRLGLTSFGGPIAHLGYFHDELIKRRQWVSEQAYADLVALCQFLPGPASSQVGIALGLARAGWAGAVYAWVGFTLPSAVLLTVFGLGYHAFGRELSLGWIHGLKLAAVAVVAQALVSMSAKFCREWKRATITIACALATSFLPIGIGQLSALVLAGVAGAFFLRDSSIVPHAPLTPYFSRPAGAVILAAFVGLLCLLPLVARISGVDFVRAFDAYFRTGALVFGGGHTVLPLLKAEVVARGWVSADAFVAGYGVAQAMPGPLFAFAAYLGAVSGISPSGALGAALALIAIYLPSFFLLFGALPFWESARKSPRLRSVMQGLNAAVVGLLLAAFFDPICVSSLGGLTDALIAVAGFLLLTYVRAPSWLVVGSTVLASRLLAFG